MVGMSCPVLVSIDVFVHDTYLTIDVPSLIAAAIAFLAVGAGLVWMFFRKRHDD